jgi:hypothetical protein
MRFVLLSLGLLSMVAACGGDAITSGGGGNAGGNNSGGNNAGGSNAGGAGAGQSTGGSGAGGGSGMVCGGVAGDTCPQGEVCDYPDDLCGGTDGQGACITIPTGCTERANPVCGCDGVIHTNPCMAHAAGTDVSNLGGCPLMAGNFACGPKQCGTAAEYCQHVGSDVGGQPDSWVCLPFAAGSCMVAVPTCACVATETANCGGTCEIEQDSGVVIHCPGG